MAGSLHQVAVGDEIPRRSQPAGFAAWNRFAAINDEFIPIHMDDEAGRAAGYDGAFGMGYLQWSLLHAVVRAWLGGDGRIVEMTCSFRGPSLKGVDVEAGGNVVAIDDGPEGRVITLDIWTRAGDKVLAPGTAKVLLR
jgi:acyl dehydratase